LVKGWAKNGCPAGRPWQALGFINLHWEKYSLGPNHKSKTQGHRANSNMPLSVTPERKQRKMP
jgi:hypothetical protein